jgi:hypothetical protein
MNEISTNEKQPFLKMQPGPLGFHVICVIGMTYYGIMAILFALGLFFSGLINRVILIYDTSSGYSASRIRMVTAGGFFLFLSCLVAIIFMLLKKSWGYYIFLVSSVLIITLEITMVELDWLAIAINILFIMLFSIQFRKIHLPFE